MILVTLGTQDKAFPRLLEAIEKQLKKGTINDEVIVQAGCTAFESEQMKLFDLIPMEQFDELLARCDLLITHGGVGTIMAGLPVREKDHRGAPAGAISRASQRSSDGNCVQL